MEEFPNAVIRYFEQLELRKLNLFNFRNYEQLSVAFEGTVHCLLGKNGSGKTNLLDAIYYLSFTKSSLIATDTQNIRTGQGGFSIKGSFDACEVLCSFQMGQKKTVKENGNEYSRLSEHIGKYPAVLIAPNDIELIWDGGEVRRRFFDSLISQVNREYLDRLITYASHLKMRNSLLKRFAEKGVDHDLLESCERQLIPCGDFISKTRQEFLSKFIPYFQKHYSFLSGNSSEPVTIAYRSGTDGDTLSDALSKSLGRDIALQRTTMGAHRDDFVFLLDGFELKRHGSQGQQKSFLIGLKLAEFDVLTSSKKFKPILLLDDIFDKLDDDRIGRLIGLVSNGSFGQLFITDARPDRSRELLGSAGIRCESFLVENSSLRKF
ncbi:MAG TPA: DNA replication and repair protein RecF [Cyclobacteriaceae bacterium]|nr:DNA replication and repair protein RecF [Cyclobacteriaceae bacterium]